MPLIEVTTNQGVVRGAEAEGVQRFRGIPFAAPPIGVRRFAGPQPVEPWSGVRDALNFAAPSAQPQSVGDEVNVIGSEDCLYLNVYAPSEGRNCPVMVWIHPGGGVVGSPNVCDGTSLARDGAVVVTIAYRLGAIGLLSLPEVFGEAAQSNFALLDMVAALHWVRDNIESFRGDPCRITLAGDSNGGRSVATLLAVAPARGLFQQALIMSGTGGGYVVAEIDEAQGVTDAFAAQMGLEPSALRTVSASDLVRAQSRLGNTLATLLPFRAVIDGETLTCRPIDAVREGASASLALMIGTNRDEFDFFAAQPIYDPWRISGRSMVAGDEAMDQARGAYRRLLPLEWSDHDVNCDVMTSSEWWIPSIRLTESHVAAGGDAWMYRVDWRIAPRGLGPGAPHGLELPLLQPNDIFHRDMVSVAGSRVAELAEVFEELRSAIVHFLFDGLPASRDWPAYDAQQRLTRVFDYPARLVSDPDRMLREVWSTLIV